MSWLSIAAPEHRAALVDELEHYGVAYEPLGALGFRHDALERACVWAVDTWFDCQETDITSIGQAAGLLREHGAWWQPLANECWRRLQLIQSKLPRLRLPPLRVPWRKQLPASGGYTLLAADRLLFAPRRSSPFPCQDWRLDEDHVHPPSRAYTKLWEALLLLGEYPEPDQLAWDLGASPGSWTWALAACGCQVQAVDKAPLDERVAALPRVTWQQGSAFAIDPRHHQADWICSDVICYPRRMLTFIERWLELGTCRRFIVTVKLQGETDYGLLDAFRALPGASLRHLMHNKHEATLLIGKTG